MSDRILTSKGAEKMSTTTSGDDDHHKTQLEKAANTNENFEGIDFAVIALAAEEVQEGGQVARVETRRGRDVSRSRWQVTRDRRGGIGLGWVKRKPNRKRKGAESRVW